MNLTPKKSLGQNFLINKDIIKDIVELGKITNLQFDELNLE